MTRNRNLVAAAVLAALAAVAAGAEAARAADEYNLSTGTTVEGHGVALRGLDAVALAEGLAVTPGEARLTVAHDGAAYHFATEEAMARFAEDPERYMPQYGGFCALGVALGKKLDGSPRFADVVDGRLYLFLNAAVFDAYLKDKADVLAKAAQNWPDMRSRSVAETNGLKAASLR